MYTATFTAPLRVYEVLKPEETKTKRFTMSVTKERLTTIIITATDATALKAITNSTTKLLEIAEKML
jgi:tRNA threonylcarbamoyladenosine modification (KEOPS) complex  Pcc1 subunit